MAFPLVYSKFFFTKFQPKVLDSIAKLETIVKDISLLGLFSDNEFLEVVRLYAFKIF